MSLLDIIAQGVNINADLIDLYQVMLACLSVYDKVTGSMQTAVENVYRQCMAQFERW